MNLFNLAESYYDPSAGRMSSYFGQLFLAASDIYFRYAILDNDRNTFTALLDYRSAKAIPAGDWPAAIAQLISSSEHLNRKYPAVVISLASPIHTLVPAALFDPGHSESHLKLNFELPENISCYSDFIPELNAWNVYAMDEKKVATLKYHYPGAVIVHSATPTLKRLSIACRQTPGRYKLFVNFREDEFDLAAFSESTLLFFNHFHFEAPEDVLYFTLYATEQLKMRANDLALLFCGETRIDPETVKLLEEFLPGVNYLGRPDGFSYSNMLDFPGYQYQSLLSLALCGS